LLDPQVDVTQDSTAAGICKGDVAELEGYRHPRARRKLARLARMSEK
jgi:hypothetical protein